MNSRRSFLKDVCMAISISLLPEILRPQAAVYPKAFLDMNTGIATVGEIHGDAVPTIQSLVEMPAVKEIHFMADEYQMSGLFPLDGRSESLPPLLINGNGAKFIFSHKVGPCLSYGHKQTDWVIKDFWFESSPNT